jgi:ribose 5-phosphate isomerase A
VSKAKEAAGRYAAELIEDGMTVGLGTGSTVHFTLAALGERVHAGLAIRGVPTSLDTERKARDLGIPLVGLDEAPSIGLTIYGADEIDPSFNMIKGGGGALLREKVVARASERVVIVVDPGKVVTKLGERFLLPIEVVPFARAVVRRELERLGAEPVLRLVDQGKVYRTDNGNEILDVRFPGGIGDPPALERELALIPGIVESGLFVGLAHLLVIGRENGEVEVRDASALAPSSAAKIKKL